MHPYDEKTLWGGHRVKMKGEASLQVCGGGQDRAGQALGILATQVAVLIICSQAFLYGVHHPPDHNTTSLQ